MSGTVAWLTGLPSSGKSTLARAVADHLRGVPTVVLDGDEVREALRPRLGYGDADRDAFYETLARLAALLARQGLIVLVAATAHRRAFRERARELAPAFFEIFVDTPLDECRRRDGHGHYRALQGQPSTLPGIGVDYEAPLHPDAVVRPDDADGARELAARLRAK